MFAVKDMRRFVTYHCDCVNNGDFWIGNGRLMCWNEGSSTANMVSLRDATEEMKKRMATCLLGDICCEHKLEE